MITKLLINMKQHTHENTITIKETAPFKDKLEESSKLPRIYFSKETIRRIFEEDKFQFQFFQNFGGALFKVMNSNSIE